MSGWLSAILYILLAPVAGGLIAGIDRKLTARMQRRIGPPIFQPFYDLFKLIDKENVIVNLYQNLYLTGFLVFNIVAGTLFFAGGDLLLVIFALALSGIFLVLGAASATSPYSHIGAERELIQMMACEPMLLIAAMGLYLLPHSFQVRDILAVDKPLFLYLPGILFGLLYILTIKLRKSPFDLSTSHHAHQEIVKGITTEFSGPALAVVELAHWYETILILGMIYLFFAWNPWVAVPATIGLYLAEILVDNTNARLTWRWTVTSSWLIAAVAGAGNLIVLFYFLKAGF
ncbi:MAG: NADH-quinone oxidoreductase subunit H [Verrucomicrobia bacterium]|nr:NADH-quinone oxidoreductase subunit H [Kiritimatiellia bacterium]MCP5487078.1 NADH-quinone oxidoreductase subunit H [Verrucomicrobiota bacterium]